MARSKKVLNDTTNRTRKNTSTTKKKKPKKLDENQWRNHILAFYKSDVSQIKFLEANSLNRDPFRYRWEGSRLRELKKANAIYTYAEKQYDRWFCQWKGGRRRQQLEVYIEEEEEEDDGTINICMQAPADIESVDLNEKDNDNDDDDETSSDFLNIPLQQDEEEEEAQKLRISKLEGDKMKELLIEYYLCSDAKKKLLTFIREKNLFSNKNAIFRHWKDGGLEQNKSFNNHVSQALKEYDDWCVNEKKKRSDTNKNNATDKKAIPVELEIFMHELIKQLALCGQGIGKKAARQIIKEALNDGIDTGDGKASFSRSTLNRFIQNYSLECKSVKNIDPARIAQVTPENRDAFFFRLDQVVKLIEAIDPDNCKATVWAEVDAACIYNIDEMGTDPTKHRDVLLIPEEVRTRLFQATPEGDRPSAHVSLAVCSSANGQYKDQRANIEGAPMPMVIHSAREQQDGRTPLQRRLSLYEEQETVQFDDNCTVGFTEGKSLGVTVRTSSNGSMTKELFLDLVLHLIKHLPTNQGANGMYSFLLLDNHVSRWNPKALYLLFKNRIVPIFFPSHLSIVIQPQDNGVILFLHKCLEEASLLERLFEKDTDISYTNRVMSKGLHLFREGERKKLITRGSNSTTRAYTVTGMKPCNPYSTGWRENLELYTSFNSLKLNRDDGCRYYGVQPKDNNICQEFSVADISMLDEAVPNLAADSNDSNTIINHSKAKCYAVADEIINSWVERGVDEQTYRPQACTDVEKLALKHMNITQIISAQPKSEESMLLEVNYEKRKQDAMIHLTKTLEQIQVKLKNNGNSNNNKSWYYATKAKRDGEWNIYDGENSLQLTTEQLQDQYTINLSYDMFPKDKRLKENTWRSSRRRRYEKDCLIQRMAKTLAEEERQADLKEEFDRFMDLSKENQTFIDFKLKLSIKIERPSNHTVTVKLGTEEHVIQVTAHGNNTSSMSQLVLDNVCRTIIGNSNRKEKKKNKKRRGGRVNRVKRGSDGFVKCLQMDQQHINDLSTEEAAVEKKKKNDIVLCKRRLNLIQNFHSIDGYDSIWNDDSTIDLQKVKQKHLKHLLKIFNVTGRAKLITNGPIRAALSELAITQASIDALKSKLLQQLEEHGEEYDPDSNVLDSSFADGSIADHSIGSTLIVDTSIIDTSIDQSNISFVIDIDIDESEIGDAGSKTDDTAELIANLPKKKQTVSFNLTPSVKTFTQQATTSLSSSDDGGKCSPIKATVAATSSSSSSSSSSEDEEELELRVQRARPRRTTRSRYKRTTRSSNRKPTAKTTRQRSTSHNNINIKSNGSGSNQTTTAITTPTILPDGDDSGKENTTELRRSSRFR